MKERRNLVGFGVSLYIQVVTRGSLAQQASVLSSIVTGGSAELLIPSSVDLAVGNVRNITRLGTETGLTAETATQVIDCRMIFVEIGVGHTVCSDRPARASPMVDDVRGVNMEIADRSCSLVAGSGFRDPGGRIRGKFLSSRGPLYPLRVVPRLCF